MRDAREPIAAEVLARLRERHPGIPIIVVTADPLREPTRDARPRGAFACLSKPFDRAEAVGTVAAAFETRRSSRH